MKKDFVKIGKSVRHKISGEKQHVDIFLGIDELTGFFAFGTGHGSILINPKTILWMDVEQLERTDDHE